MPSPLLANVTPAGSAPVGTMVAAGGPPADWTVKVPAWPAVNVTAGALVIRRLVAAGAVMKTPPLNPGA